MVARPTAPGDERRPGFYLFTSGGSEGRQPYHDKGATSPTSLLYNVFGGVAVPADGESDERGV